MHVLWYSNSSPRVIPKQAVNPCTLKHMHKDVHSNGICNGLKQELPKCHQH